MQVCAGEGEEIVEAEFQAGVAGGGDGGELLREGVRGVHSQGRGGVGEGD